MTALHRLAQAAGLSRHWTDADGQPQIVTDDALVTILHTLGYRTDSDRALSESEALLSAEAQQPAALLTGDAGKAFPLPRSLASASEVELVDEDGRAFQLPVKGGELSPIARPGYYRLKQGDNDLLLAIAPARCASLPEQRRLWGAAIQIPALRGNASKPFGDLGDVAQAARALAEAGADALAISPVHALYPGDGGRYSPYAPSSRRFINGLLSDPALVGLPPLPSGVSPELIDWQEAIPRRLADLRALFDTLPQELHGQIALWADEQGPPLRCHALFDALHVHFREQGKHGWRAWDAAFREPDGAAARDFAAAHPEELGFHLFIQWLADRNMEAAQQAAVQAGMKIGLIADLAVGIDPSGSDAWAMQDALLSGLSVGAPPDPLGPEGQNWGLTGFSPQGLRRTGFAPFITTLRANLRHAGALRIDHGFGLKRLWVVPEGASAAEGAYLSYPFVDMLRLVALESHRAGAAIIAEDLGTVPDGFREEIGAKGIYGMRVLWFERGEDGAFCPAEAYPTRSVAMTGTHDTPTVAGWWKGRDLEWNRALGRGNPDELGRSTERNALWQAIGGERPEPSPDEPGPVVDAALKHVGSTPAALAIFPLEDLAALEEQPNLPGTVDEHPNWRRRMPATVDAMLGQPAVTARVRIIGEARP